MINLEAIPHQHHDFQVEQIDGETLLYQHQLKRVIYLNESAALVWHLCDGQRSVADIIELLVDSYPDTEEAVRADVIEAIDSLFLEDALYIARAGVQLPSK
ncbi:MAG TPA: PqqD family protein [Pseudolabrys sp.]|nr:PqqD family protein [Pseudolabrys sp.]